MSADAMSQNGDLGDILNRASSDICAHGHCSNLKYCASSLIQIIDSASWPEDRDHLVGPLLIIADEIFRAGAHNYKFSSLAYAAVARVTDGDTEARATKRFVEAVELSQYNDMSRLDVFENAAIVSALCRQRESGTDAKHGLEFERVLVDQFERYVKILAKRKRVERCCTAIRRATFQGKLAVTAAKIANE